MRNSLLALVAAVTGAVASSGCGDSGGGSGGAGAAGAAGSSSSEGQGGGMSSSGGAAGSPGVGATGGGGDECATGTRCVPAPPAGWAGPAGLFVGNGAPASCAGPWTTEVRGNLGAVEAPHSCSSCTCAAPTGAVCSAPTVTVYGNGSCTMTGTSAVPPGDGSCKSMGGGYGGKSTPSTPTGGSCSAGGGQISAQPPVWTLEALVCDGAPAPSTCGGGVCAVEPEAPLGPAVCIHKAGDLACPEGFPARTVLYLGVDDTRACGVCACAPPTGVSCLNAVTAWGDFDCTGLATALPGDNACHADNYYAAVTFDPVGKAGSCAPGGGDASGAVEPASPTTVCCAP